MLIRRPGGDWRAPDVSSYRNEHALRDLLATSPALLPNCTEPLVAIIELPLSSGQVDVVAVESSGQIVLCECKLDANEDARRKVVGQLLSYAGSAWQLECDDFIYRFSRRLSRPLVEVMREASGPDWDEEEFRGALGDNLTSGDFRLIVAVDAITDELKKTILYLNQHSARGIEVLALEVNYTRDQDVEILVPESFGEEVAPRKRVRKNWDETTLFAVLEQGSSPEGFAAVRDLWDFCQDHGSQFAFGTGHGASGTINLSIDGQREPLFSIYAYTNGSSTLAINFEYLAGHGIAPARLQQIAGYARLVDGAHQKLDGLEDAEFRKRPGLPVDSVCATPGAVEHLKRLVERALAPLDNT